MASNNGDENDEELKTCPEDPRFPNQNISGWCFKSFCDYHKCVRLLGKSHEPCKYFYKCYNSICPNAWISRWEEQLLNGTFPGVLPDDDDDQDDFKKKD